MLSNFEKTTKDDEEAYSINLNNLYSYIVPQYSKNENTRRTYLYNINRICESNIERMKKIINIRNEITKSSGYESYSDYVISDLMAKNTKTAIDFLENLKPKLQLINKKDIESLLELKNNERTKLNETITDIFNEWDMNYYNRLLIEEEIKVSDEEIKEYFPANKVIPEILKIYGEIYSLKYIKNENPSVWHDDVTQYEVYDAITNKYLGSFFLDLFERTGKIGGGATYPLRYKCKYEDGSETYPVAFLSTYFPKSSTSEPTLLNYSNVITLLHEFGHILHFMNIKTKWVDITEDMKSDFIEIMSQMNENLGWEPTIIERISHHYKDSNKKIPKRIIDALLKSKNIDIATTLLDQISISLGDIKLYSVGEMDKDFDIVKYWNDIRKDVLVYNTFDTWIFAIMPHLAENMGSSYFTYLWSLSLAQDLYTKFSENGVINPEIGLKYRDFILEPSDGDPMEYIKQFLGREPNNDAFIKRFGI